MNTIKNMQPDVERCREIMKTMRTGSIKMALKAGRWDLQTT